MKSPPDGLNRGEDTLIHKDFGYGEEVFGRQEAMKNKLITDAFSYDKLSKHNFLSNPLRIDTDTSITTGGKKYDVQFNDNLNSCIISSSLSEKFKSDTITITHKKFSLNKLYFGKAKSNGNSARISSSYYFSYKDKVYLLLWIAPDAGNSTIIDYKGILINLTNKDSALELVFPYYQNSNTTYCINDFDADGILDYAYFNPRFREVKLYHIVDNNLVLDNRYYLTLYNYVNIYFAIDKSKSRWFYNY